MKKYVIIGTIIGYELTRVGGDFERHETEEKIATFDAREAAEKYIKKSKLKTPRTRSFSGDRPFKQKSLLMNCTYAEVQEYFEPEPPPHNPEIDF